MTLRNLTQGLGLGRIFGPMKEEVTKKWRNMRNEGLQNQKFSRIIIRAIKARRMGWACRVSGTGETRTKYRILAQEFAGKNLIERYPGMDIEATLKWILDI
jgi:hypothetical protein